MRREQKEIVGGTKVFVACMHYHYMLEQEGRIVDTRCNLVYDLSSFDVVIKSTNSVGIGFSFGDFRNGINSGFCGLQLAVLLGYKRIYLAGMDFVLGKGDKTHYHEGYRQSTVRFKERLAEYLVYFTEGLEQLKAESSVEVFSLSPTSKLNNILPYVDIKAVR